MINVISVMSALNGWVLSVLSEIMNLCMRTGCTSVKYAMLSSLGQRIWLYIHDYIVKTCAIPVVPQVTKNCNPWERNIFVVRYALREFRIGVICFNITALMGKNLVTLGEWNHLSVTYVLGDSQVLVLSNGIPVCTAEKDYASKHVAVIVISNKAKYSSHDCVHVLHASDFRFSLSRPI